MVRGKPVGQQPTERVAAHHDPLEAELVEQPEDVAGVILHRISRRRRVALAPATQVECDHVRHLREPRVHEPVEGVCIRRQSRRQDQDRAGAGMIEIVQPDPVRLRVPVVHDPSLSLE